MRKIDPDTHAKKRRQILDAAARCFAEKGFEATRTADICRQAGISSGKLFHYFSSKRDVFTAIFAQGQADENALLDRALKASETIPAIVSFFEVTLSHRDNPVLAGLLFEAIAFSRRDDDFAKAIAQDENGMRKKFAELAKLAIAKGEAGAEINPVQAAGWLMGLHDLTILKAVSEPERSQNADRKMIDLLVRTVLAAPMTEASEETS